MKYGQFSEDGKEYVIERFNTPRPWINCLTNGRYTSLVSQVSSGYSFYYDMGLHAINHKGLTDLLECTQGKFHFVRDNDTGRFWNINCHPSKLSAQSYECRHGLGYSTITSAHDGVSGSLTPFVSTHDDVESWLVELDNQSDKTKHLSIYLYQEMIFGCLIGQSDGAAWFWNSFNEIRYRDGALIGTKRFVDRPDGKGKGHWPYAVFLTSTLQPAGYECSKEKFIGMYRSIADPLALETNKCSNEDVVGKPIVGALRWDISLKPGESTQFAWSMGVTAWDDEADQTKLIAKYKKQQSIRDEFDATRKYWHDQLSQNPVSTPDRALNTDVNWWTKYQMYINAITWRDSNFYYGNFWTAVGNGGFRNILCDAGGMASFNKDIARRHIRIIASYISGDGKQAHGTPRPELKARPSHIGAKNDDVLWLVMTLEDYIRETGDYSLVTEEITSLVDGHTAPLWQFIIKGLDYYISVKGPKGLPLIGTGDWNDALDGVGPEGKGESVWLGMFVHMNLKSMAEILRRTLSGDEQAETLIEQYESRGNELYKIVNEKCWNGEYFVRAFKDDGTSIGDKHCKEGAFFLNTQIWAPICGVTDKVRSNQVLDLVKKRLWTKYGMRFFEPAYTQFDPSIGVITGFSPGSHENAAIFSQANMFAAIAYGMMGRAQDMLDIYKAVSPFDYSDAAIEVRQLEPYGQCQYVEGPESQDFGKGACHWLTGTAAWVLRTVIGFMLGVRPEYDGLRIDPCIPGEWDGYRLTRKFRGDTYEIEVTNPDHVESGVAKVIVDGRELASTLIPVASDGKSHKVQVVMGKSAGCHAREKESVAVS